MNYFCILLKSHHRNLKIIHEINIENIKYLDKSTIFSLLSKCCIIRITVSLKFNHMWNIHCRVSLLNGINPLSLNNIYWYLAILLPPHPGPIRAASHWLFSSFRLRYFGKLSHIISAYCKAGLIKNKNIFLKAIIISI